MTSASEPDHDVEAANQPRGGGRERAAGKPLLALLETLRP
jgi:hypothetical protein